MAIALKTSPLSTDTSTDLKKIIDIHALLQFPESDAKPRPDDERLAQWLLEQARLRNHDLERARRLRDAEDIGLLAILQRLGVLTEGDIAHALAALTGYRMLQASDYPNDPIIPEGLSWRFLQQHEAIIVDRVDTTLHLAMADVRDAYLQQAVMLATGLSVTPCVGLASDIRSALQSAKDKETPSDHLDSDVTDDIDEADIEQLRDMASEAPIIRLVNQILQQAVESRASDIHIEPFEDSLRVRLRIDGILHLIESPPLRSSAAIISRIKIMARLNIAERRLPQDGRIKLRIMGKELDLRVSTVPTLYGESVVMRLLDKENIVLDFAALGFEGESLRRFLDVLAFPHGIILVTGPTGSGKSTTLYTALAQMNSAQRKIITVEDPVEYQLNGINQIQVKPQIGLNFANALRSIVRQDPDIIMIGEMRDLETAQIAVQSALTGHLVLSTLHTNDAASTINRLLDMGLEDYLLTSTINGILAQRLLRSLCKYCRKPLIPLPEWVDELKLAELVGVGELHIHRSVGCPHCAYTGYRGRLAIMEFLLMNETLRSMIIRRASSAEIEEQARSQGMRTLYEDGLSKVARGLTTLDEVLRVTQD